VHAVMNFTICTFCMHRCLTRDSHDFEKCQ